MNNQMPYGFMPPFEQPEINKLNDKLDKLEKRVTKIEKKVQMLENNNVYPMPFNMPNYPSNYMI